MCRRKGLCVVLALCLLLATVLVPPAGVLAAPADAAGDTVSTGADGTVPGLTDAQETASAASGRYPDRREPIPDGLTVWDGVIRTEDHWTQESMEAYIASCPFAGGTGTQSDPYRIATPAQYVHFVMLCRYALVDSSLDRPFRELSYVITQDLCFNPDFAVTEAVATGKDTTLHRVPSVTPQFGGTLDGGGYRLFNLYQFQPQNDTKNEEPVGLFAELTSGATVTGVHLVRGYIGCSKTDTVVGGIAADCRGVVRNCSVSATMRLAGGGGGVVGTVGIAGAKVASCEFSGDLTSTGNATTKDGVPMLYVPGNGLGGILGSCTTPVETVTLADCVNRGNVSGAGRMIGGIVGAVYNAERTVGGITVSGCVNFGEVTSTYDPATDMSGPTTELASYVGGIVGYVNRIHQSGSKTITCVANFGRVSALHTGGVGGIVGAVQGDQSPGTTLTVQNAFNLGDVSGAGGVGGLIGQAKTRLHIYDCAVSGTVTGTASVGGMVGQSEYPSNYVPTVVRIDSSAVRATVTATDGPAGGIFGTLLSGGQATLTLGGVLISADLSATGGAAGGFVGALLWDRDFSRSDSAKPEAAQSLTFNATYSVLDVAVLAADGAAALFIGENREQTDGRLLEVRGSFTSVVARERGDAAFPREIPGAAASAVFTSGTLTDAGLTDGTYRDILNTFAGNKGYRKWTQTATQPMLPTVADLGSLPLTHPYNGEPTSFEDGRWTGAAIHVRYWQYVADDDTWEELAVAPTSVGRYRAAVAILSLRASGAAVLEFEIEKRVFDLADCAWPEETSYEYVGEEQTVTLSGLPAGAIPVYEGNRATVRGTYRARLLSVEDPTGNYTFTGLSSVAAFTWEITVVDIDFNYVTWRGSTPEDKQNATTVYTGEAQTLTLYYTKKPNIDLSKIMNITYTGNVATVAGTYRGVRAVIADDDRFDSIVCSGDGIVRNNFYADWVIEKREIDPEQYLDFADLTVTYDGGEHTIDLTSRMPSCVSVTYDATPKRDAGTYVYTAYCTLTDIANNILTAETASRTLTIRRAVAKITAKGRDTVYNGEVQRIEEDKCRIGTDRPKETPLRFEYYLVSEEDGSLTAVEDNAPIHGGEYRVKVIFDGSQNYEETAVTVPFYINRATLALEGDIVLRSAEMLYTGEPLNLKLQNERHLPDCVIPVYSAARTDPGIYKVVVNFEFTEEHKNDYKPIEGMSATLTILTSRIVDAGTGVQFRFPDGSPVPYRLLVMERHDLDAFNTNWSVGFHTSLKGLWKTELKEGRKPITSMETPFDVYLPISVRDSNDRTLTAIGLTIDENGKYTVKVYDDAEVVEIGEDRYLRIPATEVTYFGYTTRDSGAGQTLWIVLASVAAIPAAAVIAVEIVRKKRRKTADHTREGE